MAYMTRGWIDFLNLLKNKQALKNRVFNKVPGAPPPDTWKKTGDVAESVRTWMSSSLVWGEVYFFNYWLEYTEIKKKRPFNSLFQDAN